MKLNPLLFLPYAAVCAKPSRNPNRNFYIGAVGLRNDGTLVTASNGSVQGDSRIWSCHAEIRLIRKLDTGATVFVARVNKRGDWRIAKPCANCMKALKGRRVVRVYYTMAPGKYGMLNLLNDF